MAHLLQTYRLPEETIQEIRLLAAQYGSQSKVIQAAVALLRPTKGRISPTAPQKQKGELRVDYDSE